MQGGGRLKGRANSKVSFGWGRGTTVSRLQGLAAIFIEACKLVPQETFFILGGSVHNSSEYMF